MIDFLALDQPTLIMFNVTVLNQMGQENGCRPDYLRRSVNVTCRTKLFEVVSEEVLPSERLNRLFLLAYFPWKDREEKEKEG